ncbi:hypothetical protein [Chryseobacterium sediminis]|uniref:hypothetical protein n=1 Tax=Chryseobacterium sediminis TaxID=1679494 RepID=UPI0028676A0F|nr:hypothetical protein [Chryseobacterium sediminis]MDR6466083.1 hypothetical protein [Chryseobacterium sediminis]
MKQTLLIILFSVCTLSIKGQKQIISHDSIAVYFNELKAASKKNIQLWNKDLYGPAILIDPKTRELYANESDTEGILKRNGTIYSGILPAKINIANTAINWAGKRWAMIMLPLTSNRKNRINLLAHESFHSIQPSLGFTLNNLENNHLDQKEGRVYLRLELEALKKAVRSTSEKELQKHLANALTFRKYRNILYKDSGNTENLLELNEGMAEFTGIIVSGRNNEQTKSFLLSGIDDFMKNPTFVRSFAYHTTPVYGYLLYQRDPNWNKKINAKTDLTDYFIKGFNIRIPAVQQKAVEKLSGDYNGKAIMKEEAEREEKTKKLIAEYKLKFIQQPHFEIKFEKMNVSFDPRNIVPLEDKGTVYPNIRVTDVWGILTVENGALMSPNWDKISITNPIKTENKKISGDAWTLELADHYTIVKDESNGNYKLAKD